MPALTAKSYQSLEQVGETYKIGKNTYIKVKTAKGDLKQVKVYTPAEYKKYYGEDAPIEDRCNSPFYRPLKEVLGFIDGYITIFKGSTYEQKEWFKSIGAVYRKWWGWGLASNIEVPELPEGIEAIQLNWADISINDDKLKPDEQIQIACDRLLNGPDSSEFQGTVGSSIQVELTIVKAIDLDGYYGKSRMHIFRDENNNCYVWTTAAKAWPEGDTKLIRGQVKSHSVYKGVNQTVLTRCKEVLK